MSKISQPISRRNMLAATAAGGVLSAVTLAQAAETMPEPRRPGQGGSDPGPKNPGRGAHGPEPRHAVAAGDRSRHAAESALLVRRLAHAARKRRLDQAGHGSRAR